MAVDSTDNIRGTGPLGFGGTVLAVADFAEKAIDIVIQKLEEREHRPKGVGTKVLQGYAEDPYLVESKILDATEEQIAENEKLGLLYNPPIDTASEEKSLAHDKAITAMAKQESVILGGGGTAVRVVGV